MKQISSVSPKVHVEKCVEKSMLLSAIKGSEVLYAGIFNKDILSEADCLKWVHGHWAGVENFLFPEMLKSDILLTNSRGIHRTQVSEHAMSFILAWTRRLHKFMRYQLKAQWQRMELDQVWAKTVGIIGLGDIGCEIAAKAKAFNMNVIGLDVRKIQPPHVDEMLPPDKLPLLLQRSDFVVITVPLTSKTIGLIGKEELRLMKETAVLVNISRGRIVKEGELVKALKEGLIAGAALDVFETEPLPPASELWKMENVILTPHVAGTSPYYNQRAVPIFIENLKRYLEGKPLINLIDKEKGF